MGALALAIALAASMGHTGPDSRAIASALAHACGEDLACVLDGAVYAEHESAWQLQPDYNQSWDAAMGIAFGPWQMHHGPSDLAGQARAWVQLRAYSLAKCGTLAIVCSGRCDRGTVVARSRAVEASVLAELVSAE